MITLKDIKVSKNRIPVQNAIWLRPIGGLSFKIYYPHGGDWSEINFDGVSPSPDPTPTPTPTPTPVYYSSKKENKIIVGRCIPLKARPGSIYFFADGRPKFKGDITPYIEGQGHSERGRWIYTYGYNANSELIWSKFPVVPLLRKDNWSPILVHIRSENYYNTYKDTAEECEMIVIEGKKIYFQRKDASYLTADTASPFFKIIDGHLRNVAKPRMPIVRPNEDWAETEAKHFVVRRLTYRGSRVRETGKWHYMYTPHPSSVPISMKRQWRLCSSGEFVQGGMPHSWKTDIKKTFLIQQIRRNRKSVDKVMIRKFSTSKYGGIRGKFSVFREIKFLK